MTINRNRKLKGQRMVGAIKVSQGVDTTNSRKTRRTTIGNRDMAVTDLNSLAGTTTDQPV